MCLQLHTTMQVGSPHGAEGPTSPTAGGTKKKNKFKIMAKLTKMKSRGHKDRSPGPNGEFGMFLQIYLSCCTVLPEI